MNLEGFADAVRRDPLFAAEGMDLERGEATLAAIKEKVREIEEVCSRESFAARLFFVRYPIATHALPLPFIGALIEAERSRRRFIDGVSEQKAEELLANWDSAATAFAIGVSRYKKLHALVRHLDLEVAAPMVDMHGNVTLPADIETVFQQLEANAKRLRADVNERWALLRGALAAKNLYHLTTTPLAPFIAGEEPSLYKQLHKLELLHALPFRTGESLEQYGPLSYTLRQFDGTPTPHTFMVYMVRNTKTGMCSLKEVALDVHLFLKLGKGAPVASAGPLHAALLEHNVPYWYQPSTNLYACRDQTYWADIATIVDRVRRPSLSTNVDRQRSSCFDLLLGACLEDHAMHLSNTKELIRTTGTMPKKYYSLLYRTHPSIYFMPFNRSIWRIPEAPHFLGSDRVGAQQRMYVSAETVLKNTTPEEFERVMQGGRLREELRRAREGR
ncbi:MAG: hypothetical protein V4474_00040 [Patescibacteria group bacterium]